MNRRLFLKQAGKTAAGTFILSLPGTGCNHPNDLINIGMIGVGSHGVSRNLKYYLKYPDLCRVTAVCDASMTRAESAKNLVNNTYKNKDCKAYQNFRRILDDRSIDAVQISTPDHWHVPLSIMAALKGKHVCCEKPTLTIDEGRLLCNVIKKTGVVYQLSMEDRFLPVYNRMAEIALNGRLGALKHIKISLPVTKLTKEGLEVTKPPSDLDFDLWLGPAPEIPYIFARTFFSFRYHDSFSGGLLTDWGAHYCDTAQLITGYDNLGPVEAEPSGETLYYNDGIFNTAYQFDLNYRYPNGVLMNIKSGIAAIRVEGDEGWIESNGWNKELTANKQTILDLNEKSISLPAANDEFINFLQCIKTGVKPINSHEAGHRTSTLLHCGNIALKLNRRVAWDPVTENFINDPEADKFRRKPMRDKWSYDSICPDYRY